MAKGESGRIVIEVSPDLKRALYSALAIKSQTLKDWFIEAANHYLNGRGNPALSAAKKTSKPSASRQKS